MFNLERGSSDLDLRLSDADSEVLTSDCSDLALTSLCIVDVEELSDALSSTDDLARAQTRRMRGGRSRTAAETSARESPHR